MRTKKPKIKTVTTEVANMKQLETMIQKGLSVVTSAGWILNQIQRSGFIYVYLNEYNRLFWKIKIKEKKHDVLPFDDFLSVLHEKRAGK